MTAIISDFQVTEEIFPKEIDQSIQVRLLYLIFIVFKTFLKMFFRNNVIFI